MTVIDLARELLELRPEPKDNFFNWDQKRNIECLKEHLTRGAQWYLSKGLKPSIRVRLANIHGFTGDLSDGSCELLEQNRFYKSFYEGNVIKAYLKWELFKRCDHSLNDHRFPDPYEPILEIFSRGGYLTAEHGIIGVAGCSSFVGAGFLESLKDQNF